MERRNSIAKPLIRRRHLVVVGCLICMTGCHDGPLYGMKSMNPFYRNQWKQDESFGITDFQRQKELEKLVGSIRNLPKPRQEYWLSNLEQIMEHDQSPEMRRLAVQCAGQVNDPKADEIIQRGLKDQNEKVQLFCCQTLGNRTDAEATRMLAQTAGATTNQDVRKAAYAALGKHKGTVATDALKLALEDRDPSTRALAMQSLRTSTGKNYGNDPDAWIAALSGQTVEEQPVRLAEYLESLVR